MPTRPHDLRWVDVDPKTQPLPAGRVEEIVHGVLNAQSGRDARSREDAIDRALIADLGYWAAGWRWSWSEPGGGGPVRAWCCDSHSIEPLGTLPKRVAAAMDDWRAWLVYMGERLSELREQHLGLDLAEAAGRAAAALAPDIVQRTEASDAWYSTFQTVLGWYLEPRLDGLDRKACIAEATGGRFQSWVAPSESVVAEVQTAVRDAIRARDQRPVSRDRHAGPDALEAWWQVGRGPLRETVRHYSPPSVQRDGHEAYINAHDVPRGVVRSEGLFAALMLARAHARSGAPLDLPEIRTWQAAVLGGPPPAIRTVDGFAKRGRERYGTPADLEARLARVLLDAIGPEVVTQRAARAYLDICFLHPFADGNGRLARLLLDWTLTREGLALHSAEPLFFVSRSAFDKFGVYSLGWLVDYLAGRAEAPA